MVMRAGYISQPENGRGLSVDLGPIFQIIAAKKRQAEQEQQDQQTVQVLTKLFPNMFAGKEVQNAPVTVQGEPTQMDSGNTFTPEYQVGLPSTKTQPQVDPESFVRTPVGRAVSAKIINNQFNPQNTNQLIAQLSALGEGNKAQALTDMITKPPAEKNQQPYMDPQGNTVLVDTSDKENAQKIIQEKKLVPASVYGAQMRTNAFGSVPTNTPGVYYDRVGKKYFTNEPNPDGTTKQVELSSAQVNQKNLDYTGNKKVITTANSPIYNRIVRNGEILVDGVKDPNTGKMSEPELDKIIRLRNEVDDGAFGKIANQLRQFNSWDQFVDYQVSDPKMAKLKSAVVANAERLGALYAGGGTVTSDSKLQLALELLDYRLGKDAFKGLVDMHKESISNTVNKYKEDAVQTGERPAPKTSGGKNSDPLGIR